jgi:hypothetical protein
VRCPLTGILQLGPLRVPALLLGGDAAIQFFLVWYNSGSNLFVVRLRATERILSITDDQGAENRRRCF